jgi:thiamine kinase-like enzyme
MVIKIIGKITRRIESLIIRVNNIVIKIPLVIGSIREIQREKKQINLACNDDHFSKYLPKYKFLYCLSISSYYSPLKSQEVDSLIKNYFKIAFQENEKWIKKELSRLIEYELFLSFIKKHIGNYNYFVDLIKGLMVPSSSSHGDFHKENILFDGKKLVFIDWSNYSQNSSRFFDLMDYYIVANSRQRWFEGYKTFITRKNFNIFGIIITKDISVSYCIWKISKELRELKTYNKINEEQVIRKYANILSFLEKIIKNNFNL